MGTYIEPQDLYDYFGQPNVEKWANIPTAGGASSSERITIAIANAEAEIELKFEGSRYEIPFSVIGADLTVLKNWMVVYAVCWLRTARGIDTDKKDHIWDLRDRIDKMIQKVLDGVSRFRTGDYDETTPTGPVGVDTGIE